MDSIVLVTAVRPGFMAQLVRVVSRETMGRTNTKKLTTVVVGESRWNKTRIRSFIILFFRAPGNSATCKRHNIG